FRSGRPRWSAAGRQARQSGEVKDPRTSEKVRVKLHWKGSILEALPRSMAPGLRSGAQIERHDATPARHDGVGRRNDYPTHRAIAREGDVPLSRARIQGEGRQMKDVSLFRLVGHDDDLVAEVDAVRFRVVFVRGEWVGRGDQGLPQ